MAETSHSRRVSQSHIPVFTPRKSSSSPGLSNPHLGLVPPSRHLSVSGSPTHPSPSSASSSTSGGLTPFRSFKNLFFNKHAPNTPKSPFAGFGSIRRSINGERSVSAPHLRRQSSAEESPVLEIVLPCTEPLLNGMELQNIGLGATRSGPPSFWSSGSVSVLAASDEAPSYSPPAGLTDLSTIIEAENSGISKHIPVLDESQEEEVLCKVSRELDMSLLHANVQKPSRASSQESSVLDLSTSRVTNEVLQAMSETGRTEGWLHGVVVDDTGDDILSDALLAHNAAGDPDVSFNLSALDPDLAALLSPNRLGGSDPTLSSSADITQRPLRPSPTRPSTRTSPLLPSPELKLDSPRRSTFTRSAASSRNTSPVRRQAPLLKYGTPNLPSTALPRLARSASDRPAHSKLGHIPPPLPSPILRAYSHSPERPSTTGAMRTPPTAFSPLSQDESRPQSSSGTDSRRAGLSRFLTPARSGNHLAPGSSSRPPSRQYNRTPPRSWDPPLPSPTFRPSSAAGTRIESTGNRQQRSVRTRTRERSSSVSEAFAAAGLLDLDADRRPPSRFGTNRSSIDDARSRFAPSRLAFSEAGSSSSWSRRSGSISRAGSLSRTVIASDMGGPMSESVSPRTTFSGTSTAPTSVSAASPARQTMQSELQLLQDRHSIETGALLSALADSQRTARVLRDENTQLRDRLQEVEDRLAAALEQIGRLQYSVPPSRIAALSSSQYDLSKDRQLGLGQSRLNSYLRPDIDASPEFSSPERAISSPETPGDAELFADKRRKRMSTTSSLFPGPPSNMSMLMHEEADARDHSIAFSSRAPSPSSPTLVLAKLGGAQHEHKHKHSIPSAGNISPITANFSIVTGSPGSLHLRPEHELHLGDMPSLDLNADFDDGYD
ncbi:predicted protein [Postia placenta Mad-698-R]|nr:predicted protein [Postia placenta Mad-698-R]